VQGKSWGDPTTGIPGVKGLQRLKETRLGGPNLQGKTGVIGGGPEPTKGRMDSNEGENPALVEVW